MTRQSSIVVLLCILFSPSALLSQVQCFRTCAPNPGSGTYGGNVTAAFALPINARGPGRPTIPAVKVGNSTAVLGSSSYSYAVPVLHLPGRVGLDLDLMLYYNSDVWTINTSSNSVTFNGDHDWPSYGFRLDFGLLLSNSSGYFLIEADGTKHLLTSAGSGVYNSTDSTYIKLNVVGSIYTITYKNGRQVIYEPFPSTQPGQSVNLFRPNRINDTNGNFISIAYVQNTDQQINTVTDTVNRIVQFNYNANGLLSSITSNSGAITWATFSWNTAYALGYNFSSIVQDSPANGATLNVLTGISLPNSTSYSFAYGSWGIVNQITNLSSTSQTRSYESYDYPGTGTALSTAPTYTHQTVFDGTTSRSWIYSSTISNNLVSQMNITNPGGDISTVNLYTTPGDWKDGLVSSVQSKDSSGHILREADNSWEADTTTNANPRLSSILTTLSDTGQQSRTDFVGYDANGCVTDQKEYDFGLVFKREIIRQYSSDFISAHILNLLKQEVIEDGSGTKISRTDFNYGDTVKSPPITGAANHNDSYTDSRGNLLSITRYADPVGGTGGITRNFQYDSLGNLVTADLDCCSQKQWNYSSLTQYAYPDSVVRGPEGTQLTTSATYNREAGTIAHFTDENLELWQYSYDSFNRPHTVTQPDNLVITYTYDDVGISPSVSISNSANSTVQKTITDGLGRTVQAQLLNVTAVLTSTDTVYDDINRQKKTSNPYLPGTETPVWTITQFDQIGRPSGITPPSGGSVQYQYSGNATTIIDSSLKQRRTVVDYLGQTVQVDEPPAGQNTAGTGGSGIITITGAETSSTTTGTKATGYFTVNGNEIGVQTWVCNDTCVRGPFVWDSGTVSVTVNGTSYSTPYGRNSNANSIALALYGQFSGTPASASNPGAGTTSNLTADQPGPNYSLSTNSWTNDVPDFGGPSFNVTLSGNALSGGVYPVTTYDSGTVTLNIGSFQVSSSYSQSTNATALNLANALAGQINVPTSPVSATVNQVSSTQAQIILNARSVGQATNYSVSTSPATASYSFAVTTTAGGSTTALTGGTDPLSTYYGYDPLGRLTSAVQGAQTRSYTYDHLGRMIKSILPENGTTNFSYTDFDAVNTRTDARGVVTTYGYDPLHRLQSVSYDVGSTGVPATPSLGFIYGTSTSSNNNGRLFKMTDGPGSETYSYDLMGRVTQVSRVIGGTTYNVGYGYNAAGELSSLTYPSNRVVNPGYDAVGRMTQISSGGTNYLSGMGYNSAQEPTGFTYGNLAQASFGYNDHLQLSSILYTSGGSTLLNLTYNYLDANGHNNGQIQSITDSRGAAFSTSYTYDSLGQLQQAQTNDLTAANTWRLVWGYDRYGNRMSQSLTGGTMAVGQPQLTVDAATNDITTAGFNYDANGNLTHDTSGAYTFDADNRITQSVVASTTATYAYDGHRWRVQKTANGTTTTYIYAGPKVIAEYVGGALSKEYIYSRGKLLATLAGTSVTYHHPDHLSNRVETNSSGSITRTFGQLPFSDSWYETGTADKWKFTSYERDTESGLDYALNRYYSSGYGRFQTPDLLPGTLLNPQSLNRYSYVINDPINLVDPQGLNIFGAIWNWLNGSNTFENGMPPDGGIPMVSPGLPLIKMGSAGGGGRKPNKITCNTVLPNGSTVGSVVQSVVNSIGQNSVEHDANAVLEAQTGFDLGAAAVEVYADTNFKIMFQGQADPNFLGDAGNFAYGAISADLGIPFGATEAVAGAYALAARHQDRDGPYGMDQSATQQVPAGYQAKCLN